MNTNSFDNPFIENIISESDENRVVELAIEKTIEFFRFLGFKTKLSDYNLTNKDIEKISRQLVSHRMVKLGENRDITPEVVASFLLL